MSEELKPCKHCGREPRYNSKRVCYVCDQCSVNLEEYPQEEIYKTFARLCWNRENTRAEAEGKE